MVDDSKMVLKIAQMQKPLTVKFHKKIQNPDGNNKTLSDNNLFLIKMQMLYILEQKKLFFGEAGFCPKLKYIFGG